MTLDIGHQLQQGRYQISALLSRGGMGTVYLATDRNLSARQVAIKENTDTAEATQAQFQYEAILLSRLTHPNLPRVTDHFVEASGQQYLVMDYVDGDDLRTVLHNNQGPLSEEIVLGWLDQVFDALNYMHGWIDPITRQLTPIIHRDIKPGNIKRTPNGRVVLVDFGLAKIDETTEQTVVGAKGVTPGYSPLEQYTGGTNTRSDIYALGATLYTLLTGQRPPAAMDRVSGMPLIPPRQRNPALSSTVEAAILRALSLSPADRFQSIDEMRAAMPAQPGSQRHIPPTYYTGEGSRYALEDSATLPRKRPWAYWNIVGAVLLLVILSGGLWALTNSRIFDGLINRQPTPTITQPVGSSAGELPPTATATDTPLPDSAEASTTVVVASVNNETPAPSEQSTATTPVSITITVSPVITTGSEQPTVNATQLVTLPIVPAEVVSTAVVPAPTHTNTPLPPTATDTPMPMATDTPPPPTATDTPMPTATDTPPPPPTTTATPSPTATDTETPLPPTVIATDTATVTNTPPPTATDTPMPTATDTETPLPPTATDTPMPTATDTETPIPTATPLPTATDTPLPPTATATATGTATNTPPPTATDTPVPTATDTPPPPTATATLSPTATDTPLPPTATDTATPSPTATATHTRQPTATATNTRRPTATSRPTPTPTATALPTALPVAGDVRIHSFDEARYRYVPAGSFTMGSTLLADEQPIHEVEVDAFWLMETEVTNAQYRRCVTANVCSPPNNEQWQDETFANYPVTHVNWEQATIYATWVGGRLPTEAEWEKAARGDDERMFPWADDNANADYLNFNSQATVEVGSFPAGVSPYGLFDMAGNVEEWVNDWYGDKYYAESPTTNPTGPEEGSKRVLRGGSYLSNRRSVRVTARGQSFPLFNAQASGFRVLLLLPK